jgi:thioesterase domain-containing protein
MTSTATAHGRAASAPDTEALVAIRGGGSRPPLFCIHAAPGHLRFFHNLGPHLDPEQPLYGLRSVAPADRGQTTYRRFEDMAGQYVSEIRAFRPEGPYLIVGECNGGELAYEVAQQLRGAGEDVPLLALIDSFGPHQPQLRAGTPAPLYRLVNLGQMLRFHGRTLLRLKGRARIEYIRARARRIMTRLGAKTRRRGPELPKAARERAFHEARSAYEARPYAGHVVVFRGATLPWGIVPTDHLGWGDLAPDVQVVEVPGLFGTIILEPAVGVLGDRLAALLDGLPA